MLKMAEVDDLPDFFDGQKKAEMNEEKDIIDMLFTAGQSETGEPSQMLKRISSEIERLKLGLKNYLSENESVTSLAEESKSLCIEGQELVEELRECERQVEYETMAEILSSVRDHDAIAHDFEKVNYSLQIVYDIVQCQKYFKEYEEYRKADNLTMAAERLADITEFLDTPAEGFPDLALYEALQTSVESQREDLLQELTNRWDQVLNWNIQEETETTYVATINMNICDQRSHVDVLLALNLCKELTPKVRDFARFLLEQVLTPLVCDESTLIEEVPEKIIVRVSKVGVKPQFDRVIISVRRVLHMLSDKLNIEVQSRQTLMKLIGKEIGAEFGDVLVKDCLMNTIPTSVGELKNYSLVTADAESLERYFKDIGFFPENDFSIMHFASDLDASFAKKTCEHFLGSARNIMLRDLSNSMSIGVESVPTLEEIPVVMDPNVDEALKILDDTIPKSLFYFPRCMISRSTQDLLNVVYAMMEQASQCSDLVAKRLYTTARLVFELYEAVVPYHHENYLLTIPQYVALFHNNCMYLAHNLLTLGEKWTMQLDGRTLDYPLSFLDLVPKMRNLAYKHLTIHLQQQRKQILDNIRSSDLNCIVVRDVLGESAEQAVRQCLRQLQLLKNVWIGVFPSNVFVRLQSCLVNMFLEELIHRVCTVEDISAEMATQLTDIYTVVAKKAPNLFQKESDLTQNVKSWTKLQELISILSGSLKDIDRRWDDGRGPLAQHFRAEELRSLVRALFQNTQFRANLLAKIK